jgi:hypothetical protein
MAGVVIGGVLYDPEKCVGSDDPDIEHYCTHDWRVEWGNKDRVNV